MSRLVVICEGGAHTGEYLVRNGVIPLRLIVDPKKFRDVVSYLSLEDEILLIIKGLTDFTMSDIYSILKIFDEHKEQLKSITIMSNIMLGNIPYDYYYYKNDLFYGDVWKVSNNKLYDIETSGEVLVSKNRILPIKNKSQSVVNKKNPIMFAFKKYAARNKIVIYGKDEAEKPSEVDLDIIKVITIVDLYKENKKLQEGELRDEN